MSSARCKKQDTAIDANVFKGQASVLLHCTLSCPSKILFIMYFICASMAKVALYRSDHYQQDRVLSVCRVKKGRSHSSRKPMKHPLQELTVVIAPVGSTFCLLSWQITNFVPKITALHGQN